MQDQAIAETDLFIEIVKRFPVLDALRRKPRDREELGRRLDVSTATTYRLSGWLGKKGLIEESDSVFTLTVLGEVIADAAFTFETDVRTVLGPATTTPDLLIGLIRHSPILEALREESLDRREVEQCLDMSRATSHRHTKSLAEKDLIERPDGEFTLTDLGEIVTDAVSTFETNTRMVLCLAPVLEAVHDTTPDFDIGIFADATVTSAEHGDAYGPMTRFVSLFQETETLRGFDTLSIAPTYMEEFHQRILNGMETEVIDPPEVAADIMDNYPEKCVEVCVSEYFTHWLCDDLPYGLVIFDERAGIGVRDADTRTVWAFVDTDAPAAREWAETVYESYRQEAVRLEHFTKTGFKEAMATLEGTA